MRTARPLDTRLPEILEGISAPRTPDYFDDILGQVGRTRQRPGWTFPERWLPMTALSERVATAPRIPMRLAVGLALLLLALAVSVVLIAGSQRPSVPAPFGPAMNGQVVFADAAGAIRVGDITHGTSTVIVAGSGHSRPVFSPDGRSLAFLERAESGRTDIVVSGPRGEDRRALNETGVGQVGHLGWTPDSTKVVAVVGRALFAFDPSGPGKPTAIVEDRTIGSFDYLDGFNMNITDVFRPPTGDEILFVGNGPDGNGLYRMPVVGGKPVAVYTDRAAGSRFANLAGAQWSPDGSRIAFSIHPPETPDVGRAYVINADGSGLRQISSLEMPGYTIDEEHNAWSPDGTRVAFGRWIMDADGNPNVRPVVIVDLATGEETELPNVEVDGYGGWSWSPDGKSILQVPGRRSEHGGQVLVIDATTGEMRQVGWSADPDTAPNWQRTVRAS